MSRSRRKYPYITDQNRGKPQYQRAKRQASAKIRKEEDIGNGGSYKKHFDSWNIRDWSFYDDKNPKAKRK